ncbi:MAG: RNA methyltransferase [Anaerolineae bacterium]|nr:RNA methyltransferase [Anaerolineae bacterium]
MLTNSSNPTIKRIRALKNRRERDDSGLTFIEGIRIVGEAVQMGAQIDSLIVAPDLLTSDFAHDLIRQQQRRNVSVIEVSAGVFESISAKDGPQGIGAVIRQRWDLLDSLTLREGDLWIALDSAQDPGNIGTILRTADAVAVKGLMLLGHSADPYDPAAIRASMGAVFSLGLIRADFAAFAAWKRRINVPVIGTSDKAAADYQDIRYPSPLILMMGSERQGLAPELLPLCDQMARIPMVGRSDSLNLAVATSVMLYEIFNQRRRQTRD